MHTLRRLPLKPEPFNANKTMKDLVIVIVSARPEQYHEVVEAELGVLDPVATQCGGSKLAVLQRQDTVHPHRRLPY